MLKKTIHLLKTNSVFTPVLFIIDLFLFLIDLCAVCGIRTKKPDSLCIIKLDKLGDYILFRNFVIYLFSKDSNKNKQITLILNEENKKFVEYLDGNLFTNIIWVNIYKYSSNPIYRYHKSKEIYKLGFETAVTPTYSRVLVLDDFITFVTRAKNRIGQTAHLINIKNWEKRFGDKLYTSIIHVSHNIIFEFERNRLFFQKLINADLSAIQLNINHLQNRSYSAIKYAVIMPGAADKFREWAAGNFSKVADYLIKEKGLQVVLCGSKSEAYTGEAIKKSAIYHENIQNKIGTLSIAELFETLNGAQFIVSNETGAVHICAAMNKVVFCISNGNHFMKYTEYPEKLGKIVHYIYPSEIDDLIYNKKKIAERFDYKSDIDISTIVLERVIKCISGK